ncbi:MAG: response regulator [Pirellulaceae bacterium]|jgi:putative two-component system response regulator|nr:response regulator [Pirellulaceae bacterium]
MFDATQLATFAEHQTCSLGLLEASEPLSVEDVKDGTDDSRHAQIMIVDDEMINIEVVKAYLEEEGFTNFLTTTRSTDAIAMVRNEKPDIVLLDINMPHVSGLDILETMRNDHELKLIPAIVLTASHDPQIKLNALRLGASDFLAKPVDPSELMLRLQNVLAVKAYQDHLAKYSERLEEQVRLRTAELVLSRQEAIHCLARAGEYRDDDTGHHVTRVGRYAALIARELGFDQATTDLIEQAAQLHDVGKIGIPDAILHKPGKLDSQEFDIMRAHCGIGRRIINPLTNEESIRLETHATVGMQIMGSTNSPVLKLAAVIAATHHEKWDGTGYPHQISGDKIPLEGRIVAVADVFDALSSARPYKEAFPIKKCLQILREGRGTHFDPYVLDAFLRCQDEAISIRGEYGDGSN